MSIPQIIRREDLIRLAINKYNFSKLYLLQVKLYLLHLKSTSSRLIYWGADIPIYSIFKSNYLLVGRGKNLSSYWDRTRVVSMTTWYPDHWAGAASYNSTALILVVRISCDKNLKIVFLTPPVASKIRREIRINCINQFQISIETLKIAFRHFLIIRRDIEEYTPNNYKFMWSNYVIWYP